MSKPRSLQIGINLLWLIPGVVGGSEEYTVNLLRAVSELEPSTDEPRLRFRLYAQPDLCRVHPDLGQRFEVVTLARPVPAKLARFALESSWLAHRSRRDDLVHHGGGVAPFGTRGRRVVTIHDLQPLDLPQHFTAAQRRWFAAMLPRVARVADRIITPSSFTAERVVDRLGVDRARISVVPPVHEVLHAAPQPTIDVERGASSSVPADPYLLYPAVSHPHKRHIDAVSALALLRDRHPDLHLVLTGAPGGSAPMLAEAITELGLGDRVQLRGRVPEHELDLMLRHATALVFPSEYEGFGNPLVEAMVRGVPVVCADSASLPEVAAGAALLFEPRSPASLAAAVERLLGDPALVGRLVEAGRERAKNFSAGVAGGALVCAYRDALT